MKISLKGMEFYAYHGAQKEERVIGQRFLVDIEYEIEKPQKDELTETVDYTEIYSKTKNIIENFNFKLLETLANEIAIKIFEDKRIKNLNVKVIKYSPPIKGILENVSAEINLKR
ncbi:MAG: dihydroneopterin aldolase [Caldisericia bacterium]